MTEDDTTDGSTAAARLALISEQRTRVASELDLDLRLVYGSWGVAYLVAFGLLAVGAGDDAPVDLPAPLVATVFTALLGAAIVVTAVHGVRRNRGVRGASSLVGAMYGWSWLLGFAALAAVIGGVGRIGVDAEVLALLWPSGSLLVVGLMYTTGGAVWRDPFQFGLGVWILAVTAAGALAGLPHLYVLTSLGGGGGFLAAAAVFAVRRHRARR